MDIITGNVGWIEVIDNRYSDNEIVSRGDLHMNSLVVSILSPTTVHA